ncbi:MAG: nucleotide exchange factor GrpE [Ignavibacteriaceae bacterium]|jgi:molecular chaperone GrpE|nr:nucleotide exchange factor GrpE [Ignavibacteriaceae bacterium]MCW8812611.1 nucleotide exchange factor GrpE [Chlorobium sp.]MCW8823052.1 nucleotide exchange factor GrpE [Ignavibacteriaceae bacterium]MCW9095255.1 nucleotide exchange factor GrpE [Ignavibacteriaceae bacterium]
MSKHKKDKHEDEQNKIIESEENVEETTKENEDKDEKLIDKSEEKIAELEAQVKEWHDKFLRKAAEFENYKRRTENDQFNLINYAAESFIIKLLPVIDDFERSLQHIDDDNSTDAVKEGIKLVYEKLLKVLDEQGVKKMQVKGEPFNVDYHDALMQRKDDSVPPHTVLEEIEKGYLYRDKVIRHAKVIVSEETSTDDSQISDDNSSDSTLENEN